MSLNEVPSGARRLAERATVNGHLRKRPLVKVANEVLDAAEEAIGQHRQKAVVVSAQAAQHSYIRMNDENELKQCL